MGDILTKIKSKGYWRILIRPSSFDREMIKDINDLSKLVEETQVKLRGWYYPHYKYSDAIVGNDYIQFGKDLVGHTEFFKFFQSGQFIHYKAIWEDYDENLESRRPMSINDLSPTHKYLEIFLTLFNITEVFEFASRLSLKDILVPSLTISITLADIYDRQLFFYDEGRDLLDNYRSKENTLVFQKKYDAKDFIIKHNEFALECTYWFFQRFNWRGANIGLLREQQNKLIQRRL